MIFDRGSIKWASLMLPEHVKALREWRDEQFHPQATPPTFDEQEREIFDIQLKRITHNRQVVTITYVTHGESRAETGYIDKVDPVAKMITLRDESGEKRRIPTDTIQSIQQNDDSF